MLVFPLFLLDVLFSQLRYYEKQTPPHQMWTENEQVIITHWQHLKNVSASFF